TVPRGTSRKDDEAIAFRKAEDRAPRWDAARARRGPRVVHLLQPGHPGARPAQPVPLAGMEDHDRVRPRHESAHGCRQGAAVVETRAVDERPAGEAAAERGPPRVRRYHAMHVDDVVSGGRTHQQTTECP